MQVEFTPACKKELTAQEDRRVKDWRLDYDLRLACKEDVPKVLFFKSAQLPGGFDPGPQDLLAAHPPFSLEPAAAADQSH